jgi:hypothetical protein
MAWRAKRRLRSEHEVKHYTDLPNHFPLPAPPKAPIEVFFDGSLGGSPTPARVGKQVLDAGSRVSWLRPPRSKLDKTRVPLATGEYAEKTASVIPRGIMVRNSMRGFPQLPDSVEFECGNGARGAGAVDGPGQGGTSEGCQGMAEEDVPMMSIEGDDGAQDAVDGGPPEDANEGRVDEAEEEVLMSIEGDNGSQGPVAGPGSGGANGGHHEAGDDVQNPPPVEFLEEAMDCSVS